MTPYQLARKRGDNVDIAINYAWRARDVERLPIEELAVFVLDWEGKPESTEVSISFVSDEEIAQLNQEYRQKTGPTDVLSFECDGYDDDFDEGMVMPEGMDVPFELGDVVIAVDVAESQAAVFGTSFQEEVELLLTHGLLHLCGYDHIEDEDAQVMEALERRILAAWRNR